MITLDKKPEMKEWFENPPQSIPKFVQDELVKIDLENAFKTVVAEDSVYIFDKDMKHVHIIVVRDGEVVIFFNATLVAGKEEEDEKINYDEKEGGGHHKVICEHR